MRTRFLRTGLLAAVLLPALVGQGVADESFRLMRVGRVQLDDVVPAPAGEPSVELYLRVETIIGEPVDQLRPSNLAIRDNGEIVDPSRIELELLSESGLGTCSVLVLDTSRTMNGEPFDQARAAALRFLEQMGDFDQVAIVSFDDDVEVVSDFGAPRTQARFALEELGVQPKTLSKLVWDGAARAVELLRLRPAGLPRRAFVILFSDGRDSNSLHSLEEVSDLARGGPNEARAPIFTIGYSRFGGSGLESLEQLAQATGASAFQAASPAELSRFFDEIWKRMTHSFVVRYDGDMDGLRHSIEVTIEDRADSREVDYPDMGAPVWPWLLGLLAVLAAGAGGFFLLQSRTAGKLVFEGGPRSGQVVPLQGSKLRVGALEENDIVLNFSTVSRFHARLQVRGGRLEIEDLGSRNGTFVNGTPLRVPGELQPGDRVRFGDVEMVYRK